MVRLLAALSILLAVPLAANAGWQFNGVPVSTAANDQADPVIVSDGAGGAIIAWYDYRSGNDFDIYAQRLNAAGIPQWTADGVPLCTQPGNQITLSMVSDDAGGAVVVWYDARNSIQTGYDIYAQHVNGSGTALWTANGLAVCQAAGDQQDPFIVKSANNYVVTWFDYRSGSTADIYVQGLNSSGSWLWWDADGLALCTAAGNQFNPRLAPDNLGGAVVTWEDRRGGNNDIYARRVNQLGVLQWTADGVVVCNATNEQYRPQIVGDAAAGGIIAWFDWRNGTPDIYMQRIDQTGAALWGANGEAICAQPFTQDWPTLAQDFSGGAVVVWEDKRNGANFDIYGQRVDPAGVTQWTANGMPLCTSGGDQSYPQIVRDPAGGFLLTWFDYRSGNPDIYAQRMDYDGALWGSNGVLLCNNAGLEEFPNVCPDGAGGAIVTWRDRRDPFYYDIYAEHVNFTPTAVEHTPSTAALRVSNYPNPFTGETTLQLALPAKGDVSVDVFDVAGRRVRELSMPAQSVGAGTLQFDGRDAHGALLPSGVYFYRVHAGAETVTRKMVIAR